MTRGFSDRRGDTNGHEKTHIWLILAKNAKNERERSKIAVFRQRRRFNDNPRRTWLVPAYIEKNLFFFYKKKCKNQLYRFF